MKTQTAKHTPESWQIWRDGTNDNPSHAITADDGPIVAQTVGGNDAANAKRIVACVNACKGIADPSVVPELLAALQAICEFWDFATTEEGMSTPLYPGALIGGHDGDDPIAIHDVLRAAIRKATAQPD